MGLGGKNLKSKKKGKAKADMNEIIPGLYLGSAFVSGKKKILQEKGKK